MILPRQRDIFSSILKNKIKAFVFLFFYTLSLYLILRAGVFFQYFTAAFNPGNCYECSMKIDYIKQFYFAGDTFFYFVPAIIISLAALFIKKRLQSYLYLLTVIWVTLTITDMIVSYTYQKLTLNDFILNFIYNLSGALVLSFILCATNSIVSYLHKEKGVSIFLSCMAPFIISIVLTLSLTVLVYLVYARQPVEVELDVSEGANIAYAGTTNNEDSFGFLNDKLTSTPTYMDIMRKGEYTYNDKKGLSAANVFIISGCIPTPKLIGNPPVDKNKTILNTKSIVLKQDFPMMGYIQGDSVNVVPHGASQLTLTKGDKEYMLASRITESKIEFQTNNAKTVSAFTFMPIKKDDYINEYSYDVIVNDKKYTIMNSIEPMSRLDGNKNMKCEFQQLSADNHTYEVKGKYLTGILISIIPDDIIIFKKSPVITMSANLAFYKKTYPNIEKIYDDISNGKLISLRGEGLSQIIINGKKQEIRPESEVIISSGKLVGLVNKNKKIKIYGTADLVFVDDKMLNIRKITYLKSKLEIFGSSIFDFIKYLFSAGFIVLVCRFIYSYFSNESNENLFV
ncbi:DUF1761 domain-containing protein [Klebsiella pneumoniae]|uniref:DUF1761 domain-containing protein n=1 Tax=Klebsiella pneumoniae TaxID=573 RepID=UPI0010D77A91|nr:DUF1761 domain-containing protein [Klebsiella pneumoniae]VTN18953.1 Uncharacterised protein [Klebsiella pneumoniae]